MGLSISISTGLDAQQAASSARAQVIAALAGRADSFMLLASDGSLQQTYGGAASSSGGNVGWLTDKAQMGGKTLAAFLAGQPELVTNGGFDADSGWNKGTGWTISGGIASFSNPTGTSLTYAPEFSAASGSAYVVEFDLVYTSGAGVIPQFGGGGADNGPTFRSSGRKSCIVQITAPRTAFSFTGVGNSAFFIDNVSVRALPGKHFGAPADANRGTLSVSGGVTSVAHNGSSTKFSNTSLPFASLTDHRLLWRMKLGADTAGILLGGASSATPYTGSFSSGGSAGIASGAAMTGLTLTVDGASVTTDGGLYTALDTGGYVTVEASGDLSGLSELWLTPYGDAIIDSAGLIFGPNSILTGDTLTKARNLLSQAAP